MKQRFIIRCSTFLILVNIFAIQIFAQDKPPADFAEWLNKRVDQITKAKINKRNNTNQTEAPSISSNSTSLVEKSSASDLVGVAFNLAGLTSKSMDKDTTAMSATVSAFAIKSLFDQRNPLDPAYYNANRDWRRVSFTLGLDYPSDKNADVNDRATIAGIKFLIFDKRDASDPANQANIKTVADELKNTGVAFANITQQIQALLFEALSAKLPQAFPNTAEAKVNFLNDYLGTGFAMKTLPLIDDLLLSKVDELIDSNINPFVTLSTTTQKAIEAIRKQPQISFAFMTKQRREKRPNEYMGELIMDIGPMRRVNLTLNAAFQYIDNATTEDNRGGKIATDIQIQLTPEKRLAGRMPIYLHLSGDASWMTNMVPMYRGQAKISIPLFNGVEIPISVTVANRTEFIKETDVRGKIGFSFDLAKLAQELKDGLTKKNSQ